MPLLTGEIIGFKATEYTSAFFTAHGQVAEAPKQLATQAHVVVIQVANGQFPFSPGGGVDFGLERTGVGIQTYNIAITQFGQRAAVQGFGAHVNGGGYFA